MTQNQEAKKPRTRTDAQVNQLLGKREDPVENRIFTYTYSASANKEVQEIRKKYIPKEESKLDVLKRLDRTVQTAGTLEGLIAGILGMIIFGVGMCAGLNAIGGGMVLAAILGILGVLLMIPAYPLYRAISNKAKAKYVPQILQLTDEIDRNNP